MSDMLVESSATRPKSIGSASPSQTKKTRHSRYHTPASCHPRKPRRHVMPLPQPSSGGGWSLAKPVLNKNRIPVGTGGRGGPPWEDNDGGGSKGSITAHNSS